MGVAMKQLKSAVNWFEIPASDINRAKTFYESIFEIEMFSMDIGDGVEMALFPTEGGTTGGALVANPEYYHPSNLHGPLIYLNANPDLQLVLDRVEGSGGSISIEKRQISEEHGFMAVIEDSEGNRIALHSNS